jgi:hypothetical protein
MEFVFWYQGLCTSLLFQYTVYRIEQDNAAPK